MAKKGIYAVDVELLERGGYSTVEELVEEICVWIKQNQMAATLSLSANWWAKAIVSPWVGEASNWSLGFPKEFENDEILAAIRQHGMYFSSFDGYTNIGVVDVVEYEKYSCMNCKLIADC